MVNCGLQAVHRTGLGTAGRGTRLGAKDLHNEVQRWWLM